MIKPFIVAAVLAVVTALPIQGLAAGSQSPASLLPEAIRSAGQITFGAELTVPPMTFFETDGKTQTGVNHELAQAMAEKLGIKVKFEQYAFPGLQPALLAGKINAIFDVINDTPEREKKLDFIDYVKAGTTLLIEHGNPHHIGGLDSLCGLQASTVRGAVQTNLLKDASTQCEQAGKHPITIREYPSAADARLQVQTGKSNAFIGNTPVLLYLAKTANGGKTFSAVTLPESGAPQYYGIALTKSDTHLRDALMAALDQVMADGTYQKILDKYGLSALGMEKPLLNAAGS